MMEGSITWGQLFTLLGFTASIFSVAIAILAIFLSRRWAAEASISAAQARESLQEIRTQTDILASLNRQHMNRLLDIVEKDRGSSNAGELAETFISLMSGVGVIKSSTSSNAERDISESSRLYVGEIPGQLTQIDKDYFKDNILSYYFIIYFYAALVNFIAGTYLPKEKDFRASNEIHNVLKMALDTSSADFMLMGKLLDKWKEADPDYVARHHKHVFGEMGKSWGQFVADAKKRFEQIDAQINSESVI